MNPMVTIMSENTDNDVANTAIINASIESAKAFLLKDITEQKLKELEGIKVDDVVLCILWKEMTGNDYETLFSSSLFGQLDEMREKIGPEAKPERVEEIKKTIEAKILQHNTAAQSKATNYFVLNEQTTALVMETQGGAGHIQAAEQRIRDLNSGYQREKKLDPNAIEKISVLQDPSSNKDSWMQLFGIYDQGKDVIKQWNAKQKAGKPGGMTNLHWFRFQVFMGETIFGDSAGKAAFATFCARPNLTEIYDTQNLFTPTIARAVNEYLAIKKDPEKCAQHNAKVEFHNWLRQHPILRIFASYKYKHQIEPNENATLTYTKVLTDLPTAAEDFFPSLRLMRRSDLKNFFLEAPHAAPLTNKNYDQDNREAFFKLIMRHKEFYELRDIFKNNPSDILEEPKLESFNSAVARCTTSESERVKILYDRAYYVMKCPNLIHLNQNNFTFTMGPVKQEFRDINTQRTSEQGFDVHQKKEGPLTIRYPEVKLTPEAKSDIQLQEDAKKILQDEGNNTPSETEIEQKIQTIITQKREALRVAVLPTSIQLDESMNTSGTFKYQMDKEMKISAIMLGSQASKTTVDYIDKIAEVAKSSDSDKPQTVFVFTGNYKYLGPDKKETDEEKTNKCLYEQVCEKITDLDATGKLPKNLTIIPVENQDATMISHVFSVADEVIVRTGGLTSMEVEAVCKDDCRILLHSEEEGVKRENETEEAFEKRMAKKMMPWEEGNGMHIQAQRGSEHVKFVNTASYASQCAIANSTQQAAAEPSQPQASEKAKNQCNFYREQFSELRKNGDPEQQQGLSTSMPC